jgi:hypothetical protein
MSMMNEQVPDAVDDGPFTAKEVTNPEIWFGVSPTTREVLRADPDAVLPVDVVADLARAGGTTTAWWSIGDATAPGGLRLPEDFRAYVRSLDDRWNQ